jgi:predicted nucleic acid-binding protein
MNAVVDTNVIAYYLLGTEAFAEECQAFWKRVEETAAPALWQAEIVNVLWMAVRKKIITPAESSHKLRFAAGLGIQSVPIRQMWRGALIRSIDSGVCAYDTLFVELAVRKNVRLATFDAQLLKAFPEIAKRPAGL